MPSGENLHAMFRTSHKRYTQRPPANCRAAREAWDYHAQTGAAAGKGRVLWIQLLDGYWGAEFESGAFAEVENS
jgi:hypothetical protein